MARPFPVLPRGKPTRRRGPTVLFACPKLSPEWELNALAALMKPKAMLIFQHPSGEQHWPDQGELIVKAVAGEVEKRIGFHVALNMHPEGDYHFAAEVERGRMEEAKALAAAVSVRLPGLWLRLGKLFVRDGRFYRREQGYKLKIVRASNVHVRRDLRAALKGMP